MGLFKKDNEAAKTEASEEKDETDLLNDGSTVPLSRKEEKQMKKADEKEQKQQAKADAKQAKIDAKEQKEQARIDAKEQKKQAKIDAKEQKQQAKADAKQAKVDVKEQKQQAKADEKEQKQQAKADAKQAKADAKEQKKQAKVDAKEQEEKAKKEALEIEQSNREAQEKIVDNYNKQQEQYKKVFSITRSISDMDIDDVHKLLRFKNAATDNEHKNNTFKTLFTVDLALMTGGLSLIPTAIIAAMRKKYQKPSDVIFSYNDIIGYNVIEDGTNVLSGGGGNAALGTFLGGAAGGVMGAITGSRTQARMVGTLAVHVTINNILFPSIMVQLIAISTSTTSKTYREAMHRLNEIVSSLEVIMKYHVEHSEPQKIEIVNSQNNNAADPYEQVKKAKELLDMGILSEDEFEIKKKELLGL